MAREKTTIFDTRDDALGEIPGPIRVEVFGDVIWACGGHVSIGAAFRFADGRWTSHRLSAMPNFILPISETEALCGGVAGNLGRTRDGGATWTWERLPKPGWLICASRDSKGRIWIGQQNGAIWRAPGARGVFHNVANVTGSINTIRQLDDKDALVVTEHAAHRIALDSGRVRATPLHRTRTQKMIDGAIAPDGTLVIVASGGKAWRAAKGKPLKAIDIGAGTLDFDAVFYLDDQFAALGYDGCVRVSPDGLAWKRVVVERKKTVRRLGGIASYRGGWLVGAAREDSAISGALSFLGDPAAAPLLPAVPPVDKEALAELTFTIAERYALGWATVWAALPSAELHAGAWMKLAATLR